MIYGGGRHEDEYKKSKRYSDDEDDGFATGIGSDEFLSQVPSHDKQGYQDDADGGPSIPNLLENS